MSDSKDFRQDLLSAYLDESLSDDERSRVENLLRTDETVAEELELMKSLQSDLRGSLDMSAKLDKSFGDRVWQAVLAQADAERLPDSHPVRLASRDDRGAGPKSPRRHAAWLGGLAALAASLIVAVGLMSGGGDDDIPDSQGLVSTQGAVPKLQVDAGQVVPDVNSTLPAAHPQPLQNDSEELIASGNPEVSGDLLNTAPLPDEMVASAETSPNAVPDESAVALTPELKAAQRQLDAMLKDGVPISTTLMFEVAVTEAGRGEDTIANALKGAGIDDIKNQELDDRAFDLLTSSGAIRRVKVKSVKEQDTELVLIEGSATQVDRFMLSMYDRPGLIDQVGYRLVLNPGIQKAVDQVVSVDTNTVRHPDQSVARRLTYGVQDGAYGQFVSDLSFNHVSVQEVGKLNLVGKRSGVDVRATVLLLIRNVD